MSCLSSCLSGSSIWCISHRSMISSQSLAYSNCVPLHGATEFLFFSSFSSHRLIQHDQFALRTGGRSSERLWPRSVLGRRSIRVERARTTLLSPLKRHVSHRLSGHLAHWSTLGTFLEPKVSTCISPLLTSYSFSNPSISISTN